MLIVFEVYSRFVFVYIPALALTTFCPDSCETPKMYQTDPAWCHDAQGPSQPQLGSECHPLLRGKVWLSKLFTCLSASWTIRCENCTYFCTLPLGMLLEPTYCSASVNDSFKGHPQQEHETRHGSMSRTRWTIDGPDDVPLEIEGRKFSTSDEGAPMMCNLVCSAMGRHVHIDYCRANDETACVGNEELQHLSKRLQPNPDRPKDTLTHSLFWKRSGEQGLHTFSLTDGCLGQVSRIRTREKSRPTLRNGTILFLRFTFRDD